MAQEETKQHLFMHNINVVYLGVMNSIGLPENGFTKAFSQICNYKEVSNLNQIGDCDLLFIQTQDTGLDVTQLARLHNQNTFIIHWIGDARNNTPAYCFEYAPYVNITCFSNMRDVENMIQAGYKSSFLQIGFDPNIYFPDNSIEKDIDIVFFGNHFGHFPLSALRQQMIKELKLTYGNRFKAYGINQPDGSFMGDQQGEADIYRRAKIGINLSHYDYERYTSDRMFRMLGSGVCVLSHFYKGIEEDFKEGDLIAWNKYDLSTLKESIDTLLNDEPRRLAIAKQGHQLALDKYIFKSMAQNIVELWKEHR